MSSSTVSHAAPRSASTLVALGLVAALALSGCDGGEEPRVRPATPTSTAPSPAVLDCARITTADLRRWIGVALEVRENATDEGGTSCAATELGDVLYQVQWMQIVGVSDLDVAAKQVFADRDPAPERVEDLTLPSGAPARMVVAEASGAVLRADVVTLTDGAALHVVVEVGSTGSAGGPFAVPRQQVIDTATRIADAYALPAR